MAVMTWLGGPVPVTVTVVVEASGVTVVVEGSWVTVVVEGS